MSIYSLTQVFADLFPTFLLIFEEGAQESRTDKGGSIASIKPRHYSHTVQSLCLITSTYVRPAVRNFRLF